jgi:hypothetical protein
MWLLVRRLGPLSQSLRIGPLTWLTVPRGTGGIRNGTRTSHCDSRSGTVTLEPHASLGPDGETFGCAVGPKGHDETTVDCCDANAFEVDSICLAVQLAGVLVVYEKERPNMELQIYGPLLRMDVTDAPRWWLGESIPWILYPSLRLRSHRAHWAAPWAVVAESLCRPVRNGRARATALATRASSPRLEAVASEAREGGLR